MTTKELAEKTGISQNYLSVVERNSGEKQASPALLQKIAEVTGTSAAWLSNGIPDETKTMVKQDPQESSEPENLRSWYGNKIRKTRRAHGLSQQALANAAGIAKGTIQQYESGKRLPRLEQLHQIADAIGIPIADLICGKNISEPKRQQQTKRSPAETKILKELSKLNDNGIRAAIRHIQELTLIPAYQSERHDAVPAGKETKTCY